MAEYEKVTDPDLIKQLNAMVEADRKAKYSKYEVVTDPELLKQLNAPDQAAQPEPETPQAPQTPQAPRRTMAEQFRRQLGLTARYGMEGAASTMGMLADPLAGLYNIGASRFGGQPIQPLSKTVGSLADVMGLPKPEGGVEQFVAAPSRALAGTAAFGGLGQAISSAGAPMLGEFLGSNLGTQAKSAMSGAGAGEAARQLGYGPGVQAGASIAGSILGGRGPSAEKAATMEPRDRVLREAQKEGLVVPPFYTRPNNLANIPTQAIAGKVMTEAQASMKNQKTVNSLARRMLKLPDNTPLTEPVLNDIKARAGTFYDAISDTGPFKVDDKYYDDLMKIASSMASIQSTFPGTEKSDVLNFISNMANAGKAGQFGGKGTVEQIKQLRWDASKYMRMDDPSKQAMGWVSKKTANALESLIERNLETTGRGTVLTDFRDARKLYAQANDIADALINPTGDVGALQLAKVVEHDKSLAPEMKLIRDFAKTFPNAVKPHAFTQPVTWPDIAMTAGLTGLGVGLGHPLLGAAYPAARVGSRAAILSQPWQRMFASPPSYNAFQPKPAGMGAISAMETLGQ